MPYIYNWGPDLRAQLQAIAEFAPQLAGFTGPELDDKQAQALAVIVSPLIALLNEAGYTCARINVQLQHGEV